MTYITVTVLEIPISDGRWKATSTSMLKPEHAIRQWYADTYSKDMKLDFDKASHSWVSEVCARPRVRARQMRFPLSLVARRPWPIRAISTLLLWMLQFVSRVFQEDLSPRKPYTRFKRFKRP